MFSYLFEHIHPTVEYLQNKLAVFKCIIYVNYQHVICFLKSDALKFILMWKRAEASNKYECWGRYIYPEVHCFPRTCKFHEVLFKHIYITRVNRTTLNYEIF